MTTETEKATHATATVVFGQLDGDPHNIHVTTYYGKEDETGEDKTIEVSNETWEAAYGDSAAEKIESILEWTRNTEHDRDHVHVSFE